MQYSTLRLQPVGAPEHLKASPGNAQFASTMSRSWPAFAAWHALPTVVPSQAQVPGASFNAQTCAMSTQNPGAPPPTSGRPQCPSLKRQYWDFGQSANDDLHSPPNGGGTRGFSTMAV